MTAMPFVFRTRVVSICLALLLAASVRMADVSAQDTLVRGQISQDEAVAIVRAQTSGKVVRVNSKVEGGSLVYKVRVLTPDGRLREYRVDAATGTLR